MKMTWLPVMPIIIINLVIVKLGWSELVMNLAGSVRNGGRSRKRIEKRGETATTKIVEFERHASLYVVFSAYNSSPKMMMNPLASAPSGEINVKDSEE